MPWSYKGNTISQPGVVSVIDNSGVANAGGDNSRRFVLIGSADGGAPKQVLNFTSIDDAKTQLIGGKGLTAVMRAMSPANDTTVTPGAVSFVRVDPATQASYSLLNSATTVLTLQTNGYGVYTNQTNVLVKAGSIQGVQASIVQGSASYVQDNIYTGALSVQYLGADVSALLTVDNTAGQVQGKSGPSGTEVVRWTAPFTTYTTIQSLVNFINAQAGWSAVVSSAPLSGPTANYFDNATAQPCKASAYMITANLDALAKFFNGTGLVTATRPNAVGATPTAMTAPAYFTGGSSGAPANQDWSDALAALQSESNIRCVVVLTDQATIHAMADAHCAAMSLPSVNKNRVQIAGGALGETVTATIARASSLNSRRTSVVWPGIQDIDPITQVLTTYEPFMVAAQAAGLLSSLSITTALTHQSLKAKGLEGTLQSSLKSTDYDNLVNGGVMAIKYQQNQLIGNSYIFVRSVTTWLQDTKLTNQELSMVCNEDAVDLRVADAINAFLVGRAGSPVGVGQVVSVIDSELRACYEDGSIVGDDMQSSYGNISVSLASGTVVGGYTATIPAPMNFFGVTASFQVYSKTVSA
jgi:hypothetical protein